jgi:hypothetical protein
MARSESGSRSELLSVVDDDGRTDRSRVWSGIFGERARRHVELDVIEAGHDNSSWVGATRVRCASLE